MTKAQSRLRELKDRQSKERGRMAELSREDSLTDETRAELDKIEQGTPDLERQLRAASKAVEDEDREAAAKAKDDKGGDPEMRERIELRSKASLGRYLVAAVRGRAVTGAEAELLDAAKLPEDAPDGAIPLELWDVPRAEDRQTEDRVITPAPSTVGINLDVLRPMVFAPSVVDKLMVEMPMVESGTYATGTITQAATANAVAKSADVPETDGAFTVQTTGPKRVGASLNLSAEDIAAVGQANFESVLRQHISLVLSDELDDQMLNGAFVSGTNNDLNGFFSRLTDPTMTTAVADFDAFISAYAGGIDGLWAGMVSEVAIVAGVETYRLSARTFRDIATQDLGDKAFADYAREHTAGWWTNQRMPDPATFLTVDNVQQAILCRKGRSMMPRPMRTAVCPHWGYISIDDIYTGARRGERRYVVSVLVGDVILVQPGAYAQIAYQVA